VYFMTNHFAAQLAPHGSFVNPSWMVHLISQQWGREQLTQRRGAGAPTTASALTRRRRQCCSRLPPSACAAARWPPHAPCPPARASAASHNLTFTSTDPTFEYSPCQNPRPGEAHLCGARPGGDAVREAVCRRRRRRIHHDLEQRARRLCCAATAAGAAATAADGAADGVAAAVRPTELLQLDGQRLHSGQGMVPVEHKGMH
jgi:hypothetical protein